jgi:hypothetical protein
VKLWGYFMQDHMGPKAGGGLTRLSREVLLGYDRILMTSPFGVDVVRATIGAEESTRRDLTWLPHGLWTEVFTPLRRRREEAVAPEGALLGEVPLGAAATDPLEAAIGALNHRENSVAATNDLIRLRAEGKL